MVRRATELDQFVERFEPSCAGREAGELEACWLDRACASLTGAARALAYSERDVRRCTFRMLIDSTTRLRIARDACEALEYRMESGIQAIVVAGSAARCEALSASDVDFNVYVTDSYLSSLFTSSSKKAKSSHDLLMGLERELRKKMRMDLLIAELHDRGYPEWERKLTLKPFTVEQLYDDEQRQLAQGHLLNLLFSAVPILGEDAFQRLLDVLAGDPDALIGGLVARVALLHARTTTIDSDADSVSRSAGGDDPVNALHTIAGTISALLCAGLSDDDPQVPYWWTMDAVAAGALDTATRETIERFFVLVTLARGGLVPLDRTAGSEVIERTVAALPLAIDAIIDWQAARGVSEETLGGWDLVSQYVVSDADLSQELIHDLGMARG